MNAPKLSVGLPVFNGEEYLAEAIDAILAQTFDDFELIISDNASTDRTEEICRRYAAMDPRITYRRQQRNMGAAANYNFVFESATAPYFRWSSHDDLIAPTMFERCVAALDAEPSDVVLAYPKTKIRQSEDAEDVPYEDHLDLSMPTPHQRLRELASKVVLCNAVFGIVRSDALRKTRLIDAFASSDEVLLAELAMLGRFRQVPEYLFIRRLHEARSTVTHHDPKNRTAWFDPSVHKKRYLHRTKVLAEDLQSIWRARLPAGERAKCALAVLQGYLPRWWRVMVRELQHAVFR